MKVIKKTTEQKNKSKKITCFSDLIAGVEHCNGTNQHANFYTRLTNNTVEVEHYYRYGNYKNGKRINPPYIMTKIDFNDWLANL